MKKKKILIIDDTKAFRKMLSIMFESKGYEVLQAEDGESGIKKIAREENLDLVLVDRQMPGMLGEEVVRYVKLHYPHLSIVFMSSDLNEQVAFVAKAAGADLVIEKSLDIEDKIEKFLKGGEE